jgi:hypothetical protein
MAVAGNPAGMRRANRQFRRHKETQMAQRHDDALYIQHGACNPIAIVNTLDDAIAEILAEQETFQPAERRGHPAILQDPAIRLILHQLCHLTGIITMTCEHPSGFSWDRSIDACLVHCKPATAESTGWTDRRDHLLSRTQADQTVEA